jgi:SAM-dependent methyltransferase
VVLNHVAAFLRGLLTTVRVPARTLALPHDDDLLFASLDEPSLEHFIFDALALFTGTAFRADGISVTNISVYADDHLLGTITVDQLSPAIAQHFPDRQDTRNCRFTATVVVPHATRRLRFVGDSPDGKHFSLFNYDIKTLQRKKTKIQLRCLDEFPLPPGDLITRTQGHADIAAYRASILPSLLLTRRYFAEAGVAARSIKSVLDIGCGTGRTLLGWHLDDVHRSLVGCDIQQSLVAWARDYLPPSIRFDQTECEPPLPYLAGSFDLILLISVFTHMDLSSQETWIPELRRLLRPRGYVLVTMHGRRYMRLFLPTRLAEFERDGHFETQSGSEGSNAFASFSTPKHFRALFAGCRLLGYFPGGALADGPSASPLAAQQDVYLFQT